MAGLATAAFLATLLTASPPPTPGLHPAGAAAAAPARDTARRTVVLLHGLGRTPRSMRPLERALAASGYRVVNLGYPSRSHTVAELVDTLAGELEECCDGERIDFVTHSLGGILVRVYGALHGAGRIGRVVMLSPPNQGSEVVDRLPEDLLRLVLGPASVQLGTGPEGVARDLPPPDFDLGIITGDASHNPLFSWWIPGEDDGKVSVASARVEGADDFLVVPFAHTFIMQRAEVIEQVRTFLEGGAFAAGRTGEP